MKTIFIDAACHVYISPEVLVIEVGVEKGFAASRNSSVEDPETGSGDYPW